MVSLAAAWQAAGIAPDAVVGHSQGEIAAAVVAGILSLEDAAAVVALRSRALRALSGAGGMASVAEPAAAVRDRIAAWGSRLAVAAVNGPDATVVSGEPAALGELVAACEAAGVRARVLPVDYASHGAQVEALREEILAALDGIAPGPALIPMVSAMSGEWLEGPEAGPRYWYDSLRSEGRFDRAIRVLAEAGHGVFAEGSPHPVLTAAITGTLDEAADAAATVTGTLRRDDGGPARFLASLAAVHVCGADAAWGAVLGHGRRVDLPTYAFRHQRFWPEPPRSRPATERWRYQVSWEPAAGPAAAAPSGTWLVVVPARAAGDELAAGCAAALATRGARVVLAPVPAGEVDRVTLAGRIRDALAGTDAGISGIVSMLGLDVTPVPGYPAVPAGVAATLGLVQALGDTGVDGRLWVMTRGAVAAGETRALTDPGQAMLWGLGLAAGMEYPDRWGGLVDVPAAWDEQVAEQLCAVLAGDAEDQVAIRPSGTLARRLVRAPLPPATGPGWAPSGTVLVTGGTGAVGAHVARWLARSGAGHLALASRSGPAAAVTAELAADLAQLGARVSVTACDLADRAGVAGLLGGIRATGPRLTGVFHAAGVLDDGVLDRLDTPRLAGVLGVKAAGARWLHELTEDAGLTAF